MKRVTHFLTAAAVVLVLTLVVHAQGQQNPSPAPSNAAADPIKAAADKLRAVVGSNAEDLACTLRPAVWVGIPVTIRVSSTMTSDGQSYIFVMKKGGLFTQAKDPDPPSSGISIDRSFGITFKSAEEAFAKGAPFYISDLAFDSPAAVHFTVTSNPAVTIGYGQMAIQETGEGYNGSSISGFVKSDAKPQRITKDLGAPPDAKKKTYLSIVDHDHHWCIASNDLLLDPGSAPKQ